MKTLLIQNGLVIDGTGSPAFPGHVLISDDRIESVFHAGEACPPADAVIDIGGLAVAPGFIDMHSHTDWVLPGKDHDLVMKCLPEQGITTVVGGNCGFSPAPVSDKMRPILSMPHFKLLNDRPLDYQWASFHDFLNRTADARPIVNAAHQVGHATLRLAWAGMHEKRLSDDALDNCLEALMMAFDEGACGLSFGLGYEPGMHAPMDEVAFFCRAAATAGKPVSVHLKALSRLSPCYSATDLSPHNVRALKEMIHIAQKTGVRLQVSHLIFVGRKSWSTAPQCLTLIEDVRKEGVDIAFDAFPYTFGNTTINAVLPYWFLAGLPESHRSPWARMRLKIELAAGFRLVGFSWRDFQVMDAVADGWQALNGCRMDEIARKWRMSPFQAMLRISEATEGQAVMLFHAYSGEPGNETALDRVLAHDLCLFETDAFTRYGGYPNPAALGAFPKMLGQYVRQRRLFSLENAVRRMTSDSANRFNLRDRGTLAIGKKADVVVFNPETINETPAAGGKPAGKPKGIVHVFINGTVVVKDGSYIPGVRAGRMIRG
ncbi:MAG: amidohydrolase family protein [Desulfosalsimonadaceae bacterium]